MVYRTSNAVIGNLSRQASSEVEDRASYKGVAIKAGLLGFVTVLSAVASIVLLQRVPEYMNVILIGALIGAFVFGLIAALAPSTIPVTGTIYCLLIGLVMGATSYVVDILYSGVVPLALLSTTMVVATISIMYGLGLIKVSQRAQSIAITVLVSVMLIGLVVGLLSFFVPGLYNLFFGDSLLSIGISVLMVFLASFFVLCDIAQIDSIVKQGLDKKLEWRAAYGLVIGIIWLYMEFLRLFAKIASRSRR
ncbi:MAG: Bax inhibitor-1/YccA family protein [Firmicutes bacterium]|nr:Bax inhibitor-1/YccA family protein [Bacillota bacterium]